MSTYTPIVAGVFADDAQARRALDALQRAGFAYDQIGVASKSRQNVNLADELLNLDVPRDQAGYYEQEYQAGRTVISVRPDGREREALDILRRNGAYDYEQRTATTGTQVDQTTVNDYDQRTAATTTGQAGTYNYDERAAAMNTQATTGRGDVVAAGQQDFYQPRSLRLRQEQLQANKERVQAGEVQLHKEVVTEQKSIDVPVTHEEVYVERRPVSGGQVDNTPIGEDETIRVPVSEEQVEVTKRPVVTGEVEIGKREVQETQRVGDTVRREEARITREGDVPIHRTVTDPYHPNDVDPELNREIEEDTDTTTNR